MKIKKDSWIDWMLAALIVAGASLAGVVLVIALLALRIALFVVPIAVLVCVVVWMLRGMGVIG